MMFDLIPTQLANVVKFDQKSYLWHNFTENRTMRTFSNGMQKSSMFENSIDKICLYFEKANGYDLEHNLRVSMVL